MEENLIIETTQGKIRGYSRRGVIKFKGIPYAAPPVGNLRFKPPTPVKPWENILDTANFGPIAPQPPPEYEARYVRNLPQSESKCLTLNVWTKNLDDKSRPVMFWIHGGGFTTGSGIGTDGARLVLRGDVVVVSINYRLGPLGFLYMPDVPDASVNVGMLDMIAALKWVKENIKNFGGDPDNVTIFGCSAGGFAVTTLLAMPLAKGLFHKAIPQSGATHKNSYNPVDGLGNYEDLILKLGIQKGDIKSLRKIPYEELIKNMNRPKWRVRGVVTWGPVVDKDTLPEHPIDAIKNGSAKDIELMTGSTLDEFKLWTAIKTESYEFEGAKLLGKVKRVTKFMDLDENKTKQMIEIYRQRKKAPRDILDAIRTDYEFRIQAIRLAEAQSQHQPNTFMYLFSWKSPYKDGKFGAMHGLEVCFVFNTLWTRDVPMIARKTEETQELSENMMDAWIAFARTGNPNHKNMPEVSPYDIDKRSTIIFDKEITIKGDPYRNERLAWEGLI
ncbi:MAG: carboxylesterase/lipase family protein [Promethearchaeota archaeon]|jgi:para-nitrobenzyl esterase